MGRASTVVFLAASLAYPLVTWLLLGRFEPRWLALILAALAVLRALTTRERVWLWAAGGSILLAVWATVFNAALPLKLYPAVVSFALLALFGLSLRYPPSAIERIARMSEPDLPPQAVQYTRTVTKVWCAFFAANGSVALALALWSTQRAWALYTGVISYVLIGVLFAAEWCVRRRVKARIAHG